MRSQKLTIASALTLFLPIKALAVSLNPNDLPLFWGMTNNAPAYHDAAFKAQEAFFVQTGFTPTYNKLNSYVQDKANHAVTVFIDKNMPFSAATAYSFIGTAYVIGIKRQITKSFRNPLWPRMEHTVSVSQDSGSVNLRIPF